jgi:hypothetical protein
MMTLPVEFSMGVTILFCKNSCSQTKNIALYLSRTACLMNSVSRQQMEALKIAGERVAFLLVFGRSSIPILAETSDKVSDV